MQYRGRPTILIVDDEKMLNETLADYLRRFDYRIEQRYDPKTAYDALVTLSPDLVLMDVMLPNESGIEVLERAAVNGFRPPALVMSGRDDMLWLPPNQQANIIRVLNKPIPLRPLGEFVRRFLAGPPHRA